MRIEEIQFRNFRKYVNTSIKFTKNENELHVVVAENGAGKTTFLNAMTWCLYNTEPKIRDEDDASADTETAMTVTNNNALSTNASTNDFFIIFSSFLLK